MENVVVSFAGRASPDVSKGVAQLLHVLQVPEEDFVVDRRPEQPGLKEVHTVQVGDVDTSGVGLGAVAAVLLDVHAEETHVDAVDLLEGEQRSSAVRELVGHLRQVQSLGQLGL